MREASKDSESMAKMDGSSDLIEELKMLIRI